MMGNSFVFRRCLVSILIILSSGFSLAAQTEVITLTPNTQQQKKKQEEKGPEKPVVKEVPKARKQARPAVVVKPKVKVKPIKIIRPKIKKP
ncbi:MAG: hypothetical protein V4687_05765 [Bacteroidota bacterium]